MRSIILLNSNENTARVEEEEKTRFVRDVLSSIGLPIEELWEEDGSLSIENKSKLREVLSTYGVQVIDHYDGEIQIYMNSDLIGEWKKSEYILKKDLAELDPKKKLFLEMHTNCWSIFESND
jgi:hypothetical protein